MHSMFWKWDLITVPQKVEEKLRGKWEYPAHCNWIAREIKSEVRKNAGIRISDIAHAFIFQH
jgi:hypothetical protein